MGLNAVPRAHHADQLALGHAGEPVVLSDRASADKARPAQPGSTSSGIPGPNAAAGLDDSPGNIRAEPGWPGPRRPLVAAFTASSSSAAAAWISASSPAVSGPKSPYSPRPQGGLVLLAEPVQGCLALRAVIGSPSSQARSSSRPGSAGAGGAGRGRVRGLRALHRGELAEIREAAADELLAVEAATTGRRGPGQPGSARVFPGQSSSPAAAFGPGMPLDVLPGCAAWRLPPTPRPARTTGSPGCPRPSWSGWCARGTGSRPTPPPASSPPRRAGPPQPRARGRRVHRGSVAYALGESRDRATACSTWPRPWTPTCPAPGRAARRDGHPVQGRIIAAATALLDPAEARAAEAGVLDRAGPADPGRAARRDRPRGDGGRPGEGEEAAGDRGEVRPGGAVGRGLRQRRPDGPGAAPR